jgi:hypothetical protein
MISPVSVANVLGRAATPPVVDARPVEPAPPPQTTAVTGATVAIGPVRGLTTFPADGPTLFVAHQAGNPNDRSKEAEAQVQELRRRDADVRRHERAHAAAAGPYGGAPVFRFQRGPDGRMYAVGGEVGIDVRPVGDPAMTIRKMEVIIRAALAPSNPSAQDRMVAAKARQIMAQAKAELQAEKEQKIEEATKRREARVAATEGNAPSAAERTRATAALQSAAALLRTAEEREGPSLVV